MADPFEVRLRFTSLLTHLSASTTSSMKTATYALKHRDMDEDLHSCILESLDSGSTSMNTRANIMWFLEHFCDMAMKEGNEGHIPYVDMVRRDILKIVTGVVGGDRKGGNGMGANIKVARKVVDTLKVKGVLGEELVRNIEADLKKKEYERSKSMTEEGGKDEEEEKAASQGKERDRKQEHKDKYASSRPKESKSNGHKVDKRAIEQRIEEDRERNKRLRESVWAVNGDDDEELNKLWEETSDLNDDDYAIAREEADERAQFARYHRALLLEAGR